MSADVPGGKPMPEIWR